MIKSAQVKLVQISDQQLSNPTMCPPRHLHWSQNWKLFLIFHLIDFIKNIFQQLLHKLTPIVEHLARLRKCFQNFISTKLHTILDIVHFFLLKLKLFIKKMQKKVFPHLFLNPYLLKEKFNVLSYISPPSPKHPYVWTLTKLKHMVLLARWQNSMYANLS